MDASQQIADHFLELLENSKLLSSAQLRAVMGKYHLDAAESAVEAAAALVSAGVLTRFQAQRLLSGRARGFFYDQYKVLDVLGHGGMSCVYLAQDTQKNARCAVKVLSERYKHDAGMIARVKLEALVGRKLQHPHVLHTERIGEAAGVHYIVMEHFDAIELQELIDDSETLPVGQACDVICQAAEGLHAAHRAGIVHRDVKPGNIMIDRSGFAKILDFGLSLLGEDVADEEFSLAMIFGHECLGTAYYMPPEQSLDSHSVDARADIYGLGCTFYHALSGRVPFPIGSDPDIKTVAQVIAAHRDRSIPALKQFVPDLPDAIYQIVERMTAKSPDDRFTTAAEVVAALRPFATRQPIDVDLQKILSKRIKRARRRLTASQTGRSQSTITRLGSQSGSSTGSSALKRSAARADTAVNQETRPNHGTAGAASGTSDVLSSPSSAAREFLVGETDDGADTVAHPAYLVPSGSDAATPICLDKRRILIGRAPECDIVVNAGQVSSKHCELRFENDRWSVTDLGSKNGVQVNGKPVKNSLLRSGDTLTIAQIPPYRFQCDHPAGAKRFRIGLFITATAVSVIAFLGWWWLR